jgi:hypothetical protein
MKIHVIKKGTASAKPVAYCDFFVDDPPVAPKK